MPNDDLEKTGKGLMKAGVSLMVLLVSLVSLACIVLCLITYFNSSGG